MTEKSAAERVEAALEAAGLPMTVRRFPKSTRTAVEAAEAIGCSLAAIAKSLVFRAAESDRAVLVVASGVNRVDEAALSRLAGEPIARADAAFVRQKTGFAIGGVPPCAHKEAPLVFLDKDLMELEEIWAAAGRPDSVFRLTPQSLKSLTGGKVATLRKT